MTEKSHLNEESVAISRRQLLKALVATGGAITASTVLSGKWSKPLVEVGLLPAHAQVSQPPVITFYQCSAFDIQTELAIVTPESIVETSTLISPIHTDVLLQRTLRLNATNGAILDETTGYADAAGLFSPPNIVILDFIASLQDEDTLYIIWEVADPDYESNSCINTLNVSILG